ncbi:trypsin-like serine peptidase [Kitasatospora sp. NPDC052896]|uniref:trypsin-like serine peptidase n=1 Tax=Kitasatospora sp. NPDC052896 TaxID=3364061 RepID=UPI0037C8EF38
MSPTDTSHHPAGRRTARLLAAGAVTALTLAAVTACGPDDTTNPPPSEAAAASATAGPTAAKGLPGGLPSLDALKKWKYADWDKWAKQHVLTPAAKGFWNAQKMLQAKPQQVPVAPPSPPANDANDPLPAAIQASPVAHPYNQNKVDGKLFFDVGPNQHAVCSATVISDPQHPGKSNLIWTAGHCVSSGKSGQQYSNEVFIPDFNSSGAVSNGQKPTDVSQFAPYGQWIATQAVASPQWVAEGSDQGSAASQYDFAILRVAPENGTKSLEETVGGSVPVWFNAPRDQLSITAIGYPQAAPFNGVEMEQCNGGKPSRLSFDTTRPPMDVIGCTMTAGASGGGWFSLEDGKPALVSNTSIGPADNSWLAGPYLDDVAQNALDYMSKSSS